MSTTPCVPCCDTPLSVAVPGAQGNSAITSTTANFTIPAIGGTVVISVGDTSWLKSGSNVFISDGVKKANFTVVVNSAVSLTGTFLGIVGDSAAAGTMTSGAIVSPGLGDYSVSATLNSGTVANLTDNSTGAATSTIAAGTGIQTLAIPIQLAAMTTLAADLITNYIVGYKFKILSVDFVTTTLGTGAGASQTLNLEIGTTNLTGGVLGLTLANTTPLGNQVNGSAVTGSNTGTASDTLSLEVAAGGVVFTAGAGIILIRLQNMDTADAVASMASKINTIRGALAQ